VVVEISIAVRTTTRNRWSALVRGLARGLERGLEHGLEHGKEGRDMAGENLQHNDHPGSGTRLSGMGRIGS